MSYKKDSGTTFEDARKTSCSSEGRDPDPEIIIEYCWICDEKLVINPSQICKKCTEWYLDWPEA